MIIDTRFMTKIKPMLYFNQIYDEKFVMGIHKHKTLELMYVASGVMEFEYLVGENILSARIPQGSFVIIKPDSPHRISFKTATQLYNIEFESQDPFIKVNDLFFSNPVADAFSIIKKFYTDFDNVIFLEDKSEILQTLKKLQKILIKKTTELEFEATYSILLSQLIADIADCHLLFSRKYGNSYINKAMIYAEQHLSEDITVADICSAVGCSKVHLEKLFTKTFNMGIGKKLNNLRIEHAKTLLKQSTISSIEIGKNSGFNSNQSFINNFKAETGYTPTEYRRQNALFYQLQTYEKAYFDEKFKHFLTYNHGQMVVAPKTNKIDNNDCNTILLPCDLEHEPNIADIKSCQKFFFLNVNEVPATKIQNKIDTQLKIIDTSEMYDLFLGFFIQYDNYTDELISLLHKKSPYRRIMIYFTANDIQAFSKYPLSDSPKKVALSPHITDVAIPFENYSQWVPLFANVNLWFTHRLSLLNKQITDITPTVLPNFGGYIYSDLT